MGLRTHTVRIDVLVELLKAHRGRRRTLTVRQGFPDDTRLVSGSAVACPGGLQVLLESAEWENEPATDRSLGWTTEWLYPPEVPSPTVVHHYLGAGGECGVCRRRVEQTPLFAISDEEVLVCFCSTECAGRYLAALREGES